MARPTAEERQSFTEYVDKFIQGELAKHPDATDEERKAYTAETREKMLRSMDPGATPLDPIVSALDYVPGLIRTAASGAALAIPNAVRAAQNKPTTFHTQDVLDALQGQAPSTGTYMMREGLPQAAAIPLGIGADTLLSLGATRGTLKALQEPMENPSLLAHAVVDPVDALSARVVEPLAEKYYKSAFKPGDQALAKIQGANKLSDLARENNMVGSQAELLQKLKTLEANNTLQRQQLLGNVQNSNPAAPSVPFSQVTSPGEQAITAAQGKVAREAPALEARNQFQQELTNQPEMLDLNNLNDIAQTYGMQAKEAKMASSMGTSAERRKNEILASAYSKTADEANNTIQDLLNKIAPDSGNQFRKIGKDQQTIKAALPDMTAAADNAESFMQGGAKFIKGALPAGTFYYATGHNVPSILTAAGLGGLSNSTLGRTYGGLGLSYGAPFAGQIGRAMALDYGTPWGLLNNLDQGDQNK